LEDLAEKGQYSSYCFDATWALALAINRNLKG